MCICGNENYKHYHSKEETHAINRIILWRLKYAWWGYEMHWCNSPSLGRKILVKHKGNLYELNALYKKWRKSHKLLKNKVLKWSKFFSSNIWINLYFLPVQNYFYNKLMWTRLNVHLWKWWFTYFGMVNATNVSPHTAVLSGQWTVRDITCLLDINTLPSSDTDEQCKYE